MRIAHFGHRETSSQIKSLIIYRLLPNYKEEVVLVVVVVAVVLFFNFALRTRLCSSEWAATAALAMFDFCLCCC